MREQQQRDEGYHALSGYTRARLRRFRLQRARMIRRLPRALPEGPPDLSLEKLPCSVAVLVCWECFTRTYISRLFLEIARQHDACEVGMPFEEMTLEAIRFVDDDEHQLEVIPLVPDL